MLRRLIMIPVVMLAVVLIAGADDSGQAAHRDHHPHEHREFTQRQAAGLACNVCHGCEDPTPEDPCLAACPRHGSHFYGDHEADDGPEVVVIDQLSELYQPVVFAHKLHATMAEMSGGCTSCHHYSETSGEIPACRECHDPDKSQVDLRMPSLKGAYHRQCTNCHLDWSHENACGFCHHPIDEASAVAADSLSIVGVPHPLIEATETYIYETTYEDGPVVSFHHSDHVELFGQECVDCHRGNSCAHCHDTAAPAESHALDHVTECCSCHVERDCGFCHTAEPQPRFDHELSTGFALAPHHTDAECNSCHGSPKSFRSPSSACGDCHIHWEAGSFDHRVTGLALDDTHAELDCEDCHEDRAFNRTPMCENCHDEQLYPDLLPGDRVSRK